MVEEHRAAFDYDWRSRFGLPFDVPDLMGWGEAWRLVTVLVMDPSSQIAAAVAGWPYPVTREDLTLRELFDLQHQSKAKRKPPAFPRPWDKIERRRIGGGRLSIADYEAIKAKNQDTEVGDG